MKELEDLRKWTVDVQRGGSVDSYLERLELAAVQAQPIVQKTMLSVVSSNRLG